MSGENDYGLSRYQLMELMSQRRDDGVALIREHGGMKAIADHLKTDLKSGISCKPGELEARTAAFGANFIPPSPPKSFLALCVDAVQDKTLLILIGAAIISLILGVSVEEEKVTRCNYTVRWVMKHVGGRVCLCVARELAGVLLGTGKGGAESQCPYSPSGFFFEMFNFRIFLKFQFLYSFLARGGGLQAFLHLQV